MKKVKSIVFSVLALTIAAFMIFSTACSQNSGNSDVAVKLTADKATLDSTNANDVATLNVSVTGASDTTYTITTSDDNVLEVFDGNKIRAKKQVAADTIVIVTATANANKKKSASIAITVTATQIKVSVSIDKNVLDSTSGKNDTATFTVTVTGASDTTYTITTSDDSVLAVDGNKITVKKEIAIDKFVNVTATANADKTKSQSVTIKVKAPIIEGQVGDLTSEKIQALGNENITVSGIVTDHYEDLNASYNSGKKVSEFKVEMSGDKWNSSWNRQGSSIHTVNHYRRGEAEVKYTDIDGKIKNGHALQEAYVDKNNQIALRSIKDYRSIVYAWEAQHYWNHLGQLDVNKFEYDPAADNYEYKINLQSEDDVFLMAYFAQSLTPLLNPNNEYFVKFRLILNENGEIAGAYGRTSTVYDGGETDDPKNASYLEYTEVELTFSNVGTTVATDPAPYTVDEDDAANIAVLQSALDNMAAATSYQFKAVDNSTKAPSTDTSEYSYESLNGSGSLKTPTGTMLPLGDYTSATGPVGVQGWVTPEVILLAKTGKYSASMDDKLYHTEYSGYKQMTNEYYEYFEYATAKTDNVVTDSFFQGKRRTYGNIADTLPNFDFSADMFTCTNANKKTGLYTYELLNTVITREIASAGSPVEGNYGYDSPEAVVTIVVDANNNVVKSFSFPYNMNDNYYGTYDVTYSNVGSGALPYSNLFDNYVARVWRESWNLFETKYYYPDHSSYYFDKDGNKVWYSGVENAEVAMKAVYGEDGYAKLPQPGVLMKVFGDLIYGPFFDWKETGTDASGNTIYVDYFSINTESSVYDENSQIDEATYNSLIEQLKTELAKTENGGYMFDSANSRTDGGTTGRQDRYVTLYNDKIQIVIWNNFTRNFSIYFYPAGTWTLK